MGPYPLKEQVTLALPASPRRLIEGVLEVEGPTSVDAGLASCLLFNNEPRRLRDDLFDGKILVGMIRLGGNKLQKGAPWEISRHSGAFVAQTVNWNFTVEKRRDNWSK